MAILNAAYSGNSPTGLVSSPIGIPVERTFEENGIRSRYRGQIIHNPVACKEGAFPEPPQIVYDESDFDDDSDEDTPFSSLSPQTLTFSKYRWLLQEAVSYAGKSGMVMVTQRT